MECLVVVMVDIMVDIIRFSSRRSSINILLPTRVLEDMDMDMAMNMNMEMIMDREG